MTGFNRSIETRLFVAIAMVALAVFLPAWGKMNHDGAGYELGLGVAGLLATIATMYGTLSAYDGWNVRTFFLYIPWTVFGAASCTVLAIGIMKSASIGRQAGLALVALMQLLAMFLPVISWYMDRRETEQ
jgi:hypothetical protein